MGSPITPANSIAMVLPHNRDTEAILVSQSLQANPTHAPQEFKALAQSLNNGKNRTARLYSGKDLKYMQEQYAHAISDYNVGNYAQARKHYCKALKREKAIDIRRGRREKLKGAAYALNDGVKKGTKGVAVVAGGGAAILASPVLALAGGLALLLGGCGSAIVCQEPLGNDFELPENDPTSFQGNPEVPLGYDSLLENSRITSAIELNPYVRRRNYEGLLLQRIEELETGNTHSWYDQRHTYPFTGKEFREAFLKKVALSLYVEVNGLVPWGILDYSDKDLAILLSDRNREFYCTTDSSPNEQLSRTFNHNPLLPFAYAQDFRDRHPDFPVLTPKDFLDLLLITMREDGWLHIPELRFDEMYQVCDSPILFFDFECMAQQRRGGSPLNALFFHAVLQAQNVPSQHTYRYFGHSGMLFPSLGLSMDGDAIWTPIYSGYLYYVPNPIPVDHSYLPLNLYHEWVQLPVCEAKSQLSRWAILNYFSLYNNPSWNEDLRFAYCSEELNDYPGEFLRGPFIQRKVPRSCQIERPSLEDYYPPMLTPEEWDDWLTKISDTISCETDLPQEKPFEP